jgi:homocysteine S-methyltransferase
VKNLIREYLKKNILITDGAMGTYYAEITGQYNEFPEISNLNDSGIIERIHNEYIAAGAKLIKTNTFSANSMILGLPRTEVEKVITAGIEIANRAARNRDVFVAASIGPIPDLAGNIDLDQALIADEYKFIVDVFLEKQVKIFIFETFSDTIYLQDMIKHIKEQDESVFVVTQFATTPEGFTRKGISVERIIAEVKKIKGIDAYGFNCGVGPAHLYNTLKNIQGIDFTNEMVAVAPNAGYPEIINERTVYIRNTSYFAERMKEISKLGIKILGGCCGTTPAHIEQIVKLITPEPVTVFSKQRMVEVPVLPRSKKATKGLSGITKNNKFLVAVELDPPFNSDIKTIMENAHICKESGVDIITVADSPMGRARVDSMMLAAKIKREVGIEVLPHICCRDKNLNALKSSILAGYMENIRNLLAITGDPVAIADKNDIKAVFNLNSFKLIELLSIMNKELFAGDPVRIGGALDLNVLKPESELSRMKKKMELGATFFLTQPIFDDAVIDFLPQAKNDQSILLGGIMPLVSYRNAQFLNNEVAGIRIPEKILNKFDCKMEREEAENLGIEIAVELGKQIQNHVDGFYFITPFNRIQMIIKIINQLNLR